MKFEKQLNFLENSTIYLHLKGDSEGCKIMKLNFSRSLSRFIFLVVLIFALHSCKEVGPQVDFGKGKKDGLLLDTTYSETPVVADAKNIVIEEFTGVQCLNCPTGHAILEDLKTQNPGRVIGVSLHSNFQDDSYPSTKQVLTSEEAQQIENYLVFPGYKPNGGVNRKYSDAATPTSLCVDYFNWQGYVNTELTATAPVNIILQKTYDVLSRELTIDVELHYTQNLTEKNKLSIFLLEDSIVTSQLKPNNSVDSNYVHENIFRTAVTEVLGDRITNTPTAGMVVKRIYKTKALNALWKPEHLKVAVFVHKYENSKEILQGKELKF